jgi:hypothetical protein
MRLAWRWFGVTRCVFEDSELSGSGYLELEGAISIQFGNNSMDTNLTMLLIPSLSSEVFEHLPHVRESVAQPWKGILDMEPQETSRRNVRLPLGVIVFSLKPPPKASFEL